MVVQVPGNPVPVLEHVQPLLIGSGVGQFQGDGGLDGEGLGHVELSHREAEPTSPPSDNDGSTNPGVSAQRTRHDRTHIEGRLQVDVVGIARLLWIYPERLRLGDGGARQRAGHGIADAGQLILLVGRGRRAR